MQVVGTPVNWILRTEGLFAFLAAIYFYDISGFSWVTFLIAFFIPDLSMLGYLVNNHPGAIAYNMAHSYIGAIICLTAGFIFSVKVLLLISLIWVAHIGFDRALGYGLKYTRGFGFTHLGQTGKKRDT
ncbi:DUF4260 domain-containing protein [Neptunicella marina]|uniref:DUF4260 domain-containing protein n=1 Tax=Neptunicella marina TaxID=2125989 RepID=A0A8J6ITD2_9ALTE|nr:DUF4260 domain-containing protein [Neptunicella marina]MBC3765073.1 DUF4260 domain-containing protein [Neptunicella marina]